MAACGGVPGQLEKSIWCLNEDKNKGEDNNVCWSCQLEWDEIFWSLSTTRFQSLYRNLFTNQSSVKPP